ncbi:hypothetical protein HJC23_001919 [Cyclotella cryptica]|uniref:Uncharacterized protein n=1 Tax=Cyclotella cryptica TaxID=29204 RepID=A0ABD3P4F0_9STRA
MIASGRSSQPTSPRDDYSVERGKHLLDVPSCFYDQLLIPPQSFVCVSRSGGRGSVVSGRLPDEWAGTIGTVSLGIRLSSR